jgi:hypothetical protein
MENIQTIGKVNRFTGLFVVITLLILETGEKVEIGYDEFKTRESAIVAGAI